MFLKKRKLIKKLAILVVLINLIFIVLFLLGGYHIRYLLIINILCIFFALLTYLANQKIVSLYNEIFAVYPTKKNYRKCDIRNYDVVNLGSSEAKKLFNYQGEKVKGLNWAQPFQSLKYDFLILKNFHSVIKKDGVVILPISIENLLLVENSSSQKSFYAKFIDPLLLSNGNFSHEVKKQKNNNQYPLFFDFSNSIKLLLNEIKNNLRKKGGAPSFHESLKYDFSEVFNWESEAKNKVETIKKIISFCDSRSLRFVLLILKYNEEEVKGQDYAIFCRMLKLIEKEIDKEKIKIISRFSHEVLDIKSLAEYEKII